MTKHYHSTSHRNITNKKKIQYETNEATYIGDFPTDKDDKEIEKNA